MEKRENISILRAGHSPASVSPRPGIYTSEPRALSERFREFNPHFLSRREFAESRALRGETLRAETEQKVTISGRFHSPSSFGPGALNTAILFHTRRMSGVRGMSEKIKGRKVSRVRWDFSEARLLGDKRRAGTERNAP